MTDISRIGIEADYSSLPRARDEMGRFARAGREAGDSADKLGSATQRAASPLASLGRFAVGAAAGLVTVGAAMRTITNARQFNASLAEASTLLGGNAKATADLAKASRTLARTYGGSAQAQVKGFYQAISAGAGSVAEANKILDISNKLAIGGVTDITTAVDGLTTALNAYGPANLSASEAADAMFVGMKAGKTTIGELSASLGNVIPLASAAGVSFDELVAGTAALTTQGQTTSVAVTGLRQVIASVIKPTQQANDMAEKLGLSFNAQALEAQGLQGFLEEVIDKTGGSKEAMAQLFGSVEALNAALAFSGGAGEKFAEIMEDMGNKAGAADQAFEVVARQLDQRLNVVMAEFADRALTVGNALLAVAVPALEGVLQILQFLEGNWDIAIAGLTGIGVALTATFIPALGGMASAAIAGANALRILTVSLLTNPFTAVAVAVTAVAFGLLRLVKNTGSWGGALNALKAVASSVWVFISNTAQAMGRNLQATWISIQSAFVRMAQAIQSAWASVMSSIADAAESLAGTKFGAALGLEFDGLRAAADRARNATVSTGIALDHMGEKAATLRGEAIRLQREGIDTASRAFATLMLQLSNSTAELEEGGLSMAELKAQMAEAGVSAEDLGVSLEDLPDLLDEINGGGGSGGRGSKGLPGMTNNLKDLNEVMRDETISAIDSFSSAWGNFVSRGFSDFKGFVDSVWKSFQSLIGNMIAAATRNRILISLGLQGGVSGAGGVIPGAPGIPGGGGILGALGGKLFGSFGGTGSILGTGIGLGGGTGFLGGLGNAVSGGLGNIFNVGANAAAAGGGFGATLGAVAPILAGAALIFSFFKSKTKELDRGLRLAADGMTVMVDQFRVIEKKRFWGLSKKVSTQFTELDQEAANEIGSAITNIQDSVLSMGEQLGMSASIYDGFVREIRISTKGLSDEEAQREIEKGLEDLSNAMANVIVVNSELYSGFDDASELLTILTTSLTAANTAFRDLGFQLFNISIAGADAATQFVALFGGIDQFVSAASFYYQNFYSEQERFDNAMASLSDAFGELFLVVPNSVEQFRALVEAAEASGNQETLARLLQLAPAFMEVTEAADRLGIGLSSIASLQDRLSDAQQAVNDAFTTYEQSVSEEVTRKTEAAAAQIEVLQSAIDNLAEAADDATDRLESAYSALSDSIGEELSRIASQADSDVEALNNELSRLQDLASGAATEVESAFSALETFIGNELTRVAQEAEASVADLNAELALAETRFQTASSSLSDIASAFEALVNAEIDRVTEDFDSQIEGLRDTLVGASDAAELAQANFEAAAASYEAFLERQIEASRDLIASYEDQASEAESLAATLADELQSALSGAQDNVAELGQVLDDTFNLVIQRLQGRQNSLTSALTLVIDSTINGFQSTVDQLSNTLLQFSSDIDRLLIQRGIAGPGGAAGVYGRSQGILNDLLTSGRVPTEQEMAQLVAGIGTGNTSLFSDSTSYQHDFNKTNARLRQLADQLRVDAPDVNQDPAIQAQLDALRSISTSVDQAALDEIAAVGGIVDAATIANMLAEGRYGELVSLNTAAAEALVAAQQSVEADIASAEAAYEAAQGITAVSDTMDALLAAASDYTAAALDLVALEESTEAQLAQIEQNLASELESIDQLIAQEQASIQLLEQDLAAVRALTDTAQGIGASASSMAELQSLLTTYEQEQALFEALQTSVDEQVATLEATRDATVASLQEMVTQARAQTSAASGGTVVLGSIDEGMVALNEAAAEYIAAQSNLATVTDRVAEDIQTIRDNEAATVDLLNEALSQARADYEAALAIGSSITSVDQGVTALVEAISAQANAEAELEAYRSTLEAEIQAIRDLAAADEAHYRSMLETAEAQYNAALGLSTELTSIDDQLVEFNSALAGYSSAQAELSAIIAQNQPLIDSINSTLDSEITALNETLEAFRSEVAPLSTLDDSLASLESAISALADAQQALANAQGGQGNQSTMGNRSYDTLTEAQIGATYNRVLQRDPDDGGLAYYSGQVNSGNLDISELPTILGHSDEYFSRFFLPQLDGAYQQFLGRNPMSEGQQYWWNQYKSGQNMSSIMDAVASSPEAQLYAQTGVPNPFIDGVPSFAMGGMHSGGLRLVGENGPELEFTGAARYLSNNSLELLGGSQSSSSTTLELRKLRQEMQARADQQEEINKQHYLSALKTEKTLKRLETNGVDVKAKEATGILTRTA